MSGGKRSKSSHVTDVRPEFALLGFLTRGPASGYDLYNDIDRELGMVWRMSQSQMYAVLKRLVEQGLARERETDSARAKRVISITASGESRFAEWLDAPSDCGARVLRAEFVSRLYFSMDKGRGEPVRLASAQMASIERQLRNHDGLALAKGAPSGFNGLGLSFRVYQLRSELAWIREAVLPFLASLKD